MSGRAGRAACFGLLLCLPFALYGVNLDDYFLGDDFDLLVSIHDQPASYFWQLLYANESGDAWRDAGLDEALGRGYLRPVKIWLLEANQIVSGTDPFGYHLTSTLVFSALLISVFLLFEELLPRRRPFALLAAGAVGLHPTFAEIVPFITAREEILAALFGVLAILGFVRFRRRGASPLPFYAFYALALLSKESALPVAAMALGYDLAYREIDLRSARGRRDALRVHAPTLLLILVYLGLRTLAFGNPKGGDVGETHFTSLAALARFHSAFFRSLLAPSQLAVPWPGLLALLVVLGAVAALLRVWRRGELAHLAPLLLFVGPVWYAGSTALQHGTYFTTRHHGMAVIGLGLLLCTLLASATRRLTPMRQWCISGALLAGCGLAFVPPAYALARHYHAAAGVVERVRQAIDEHTRHLPDGCSVKLLNVPQWTERPWYFGWGLRSALSRPFTPGGLAERCLVYDARNVALTKADIVPPKHFDLVIDVATSTPRGSGAAPAPPRGGPRR
jgi:hypothetical protein